MILLLHISISLLLVVSLVLSFFPSAVSSKLTRLLPALTAGSGLSGLWLIATTGGTLAASCLRSVLLLTFIIVTRRTRAYNRA